jgi:hypothetical protein
MRFWLCGPPVLSGLVFITVFVLCGVANAKADQLPKFSQFPAREYNRGPTGRVDLSDPHAYSYRTRLREGAQQGANFAGHYRVVTWGCGTDCGTGAIIDAFTGHVVFLPSVNSYQMEHEMDPDFNSIVFRLDSRLIVFAGQLNDQGGKATFFMDFDGKTFRQVYQVIDKGAAEQPLAIEKPPIQAPSGPNTPAQSNADLSSADVRRIHSTYENNEARFFRDFAGRHFSSKMPITRISENPIFRGSFDVFFGGDGLLGDVKCEFSDKNDVARITEMNKGDIVNVIGVIKDHSFGVIELKECSISAASDADWSLYSGMDALVPAKSATPGNKDADVVIENMKTYASNCAEAYFRTKSGTFKTLDLLSGGLGECQFLTLNNTMPGTVADKKIMDRYIEINDLPTRAEQDKEIDKEPAITIGAMFGVRDAVTNIFMGELAKHCTYLGGHNDTSEVSCK